MTKTYVISAYANNGLSAFERIIATNPREALQRFYLVQPKIDFKEIIITEDELCNAR